MTHKPEKTVDLSPQEEAKSLIQQFVVLYEGVTLGYAKRHWAKKSALITVNKLLSELEYGAGSDGAYDYYEEVKIHLENYDIRTN